MKKIILLFALFLILANVSIASEIPIISSYVTDNTGILSPAAKSQLESDLRNLEMWKKYRSKQFLVLNLFFHNPPVSNQSEPVADSSGNCHSGTNVSAHWQF